MSEPTRAELEPVPNSATGEPAKRNGRARVAERLGSRRGRHIAWAVLCLLAAGYVAFGRVTVYVGDGDERRLSIRRVWSLLGDGLPSVEHASFLSAVYVTSLLVLIVTSIAGLWLALVGVGPTIAESGAPSANDPGDRHGTAEGAAGHDRP